MGGELNMPNCTAPCCLLRASSAFDALLQCSDAVCIGRSYSLYTNHRSDALLLPASPDGDRQPPPPPNCRSGLKACRTSSRGRLFHFGPLRNRIAPPIPLLALQMAEPVEGRGVSQAPRIGAFFKAPRSLPARSRRCLSRRAWQGPAKSGHAVRESAHPPHAPSRWPVPPFAGQNRLRLSLADRSR